MELTTIYSKKGILVETYHMLNGVLQGYRNTYYTNGQLKSTTHYNNGLKDGLSSHYHRNGNVKEMKVYKDGVLISSTGYHLNGNIEYIKSYNSRGDKDGLTIWMDQYGVLTSTELYIGGKFEKELL